MPARDHRFSLPVIVDPFSRFGDEIAGETPDEIALNLAGATRVALFFRCKPLRPCVSPWQHFQGCKADLSPEATAAVIFTAEVYLRFAGRRFSAAGGRETEHLAGGEIADGRQHHLPAGSTPALTAMQQTLF